MVLHWPEWYNVPLIIGVNWFVLAIGARGCANRITQNTIFQVLCAALFMVGLDYFIEPVAMKYDFWDWSQNKVPLQNYFMWFLVSILMQVFVNKRAYKYPFHLHLLY